MVTERTVAVYKQEGNNYIRQYSFPTENRPFAIDEVIRGADGGNYVIFEIDVEVAVVPEINPSD
ncbi:hypothetical protein SIM22_06005 [Bacillus cereus group sp. BfR-BA-01363]|uniref:hypothetical protein n=1 Tax=Bacillus cereus group sp. BfR-BA-01363 TaxID=3094882 RepID=UPI0029C509F1|nr:hypothetical protein [Bacillus cereus group sp. BfR-BA-01363]MDX5853657.1 hypothetical protein [Bacillus cereus group sp. BfR-BA-01363]